MLEMKELKGGESWCETEKLPMAAGVRSSQEIEAGKQGEKERTSKNQ